MENSKKIQYGLLGLVAVLLVANLFGGGFKSWFGLDKDAKIRDAATASSGLASGHTEGTALPTSGNIPGTNIVQPAAPSGPSTSIKYEGDVFDFGVVDEGEVVKHMFKFKNTGTEPLIISNAKGSCGCTVPTWPKEPIPPGGLGEIKIEFNSKGKPGNQSKRVTVTANTVPTETFLEIKGLVKGKDMPATAKGAETRPTAPQDGQLHLKPKGN